MAKTSLLAISVALSVAVGGLGLAKPASAIQVNFVQGEGDAPVGWTNLEWKVEGRAGVSGSGDYELAIGPNGAQADLVDQEDWQWQNGEVVNWSLTWNGSNNPSQPTVLFTFGDPAQSSRVLTYTYTPPSTVFNGFYLLTKSLTTDSGSTFVDPGTKIDFAVTTLNGETVTDQFNHSLLSSATSPTSGQDLNQKFFFSPVGIESLTGTATMSWTGRNPQVGNGRSRVDFQISGYNVGGNPPPESVPEPTSTLSLLALGTFGVGSMLKQRQKPQP